MQRPCVWEPGLLKKIKKTPWQELVGQRRKRLKGHWSRARAMVRSQVHEEAEQGEVLTKLRLSCPSRLPGLSHLPGEILG